ncbi:MAG: hypothetical protein ACLU4N_18660 [Butyricimonas faecihominis]
MGNANFGSSFSHYTVYKNGSYNYADKCRLIPWITKNEDLKWEMTDGMRGVDFGSLETVCRKYDYYYKKTTGLLETFYYLFLRG